MSNFTRPISGRSNRTGFVIYLLAICVEREKVREERREEEVDEYGTEADRQTGEEQPPLARPVPVE